MEFEEALDDGYNWKKYGQKDILGAKHPRYDIYKDRLHVLVCWFKNQLKRAIIVQCSKLPMDSLLIKRYSRAHKLNNEYVTETNHLLYILFVN